MRVRETKLVLSALVEDDDKTNGWMAVETLRLILIPAIVVILFFGGVFWLRHQVAAGGGMPEATSVVKVELLPRPDPIPIPIAASDTPATGAPSVATQAGTSRESPAAPNQEIMAALPSELPSAASPAAPAPSQRATSDVVPDSAVMQFRTALLRHIARFQRYPQGSQQNRLQGTVQAGFSMNRGGQVLRVWIKTSSGQVALDQAAIDTIRRAQPLPAVPAGLPDPIKIEIALGFDPS